jgi:thiosulfate/3-mercaptopyruvate sulfurtransferase
MQLHPITSLNGRMSIMTPLSSCVMPSRDDKQADVVAYCNTGWWSTTDWFVLHELLGFENTALYVESMAGWTADPANPVTTEPTTLD